MASKLPHTYEIPDANPFYNTKKWNTKMQRKKKKKQKSLLFTRIIFIPRKLQQFQDIPTTTWWIVAMATQYFSVRPNNTTRGNGCELGGSGWTLQNKFFTRAVVHNQKGLPRKAVEVQSWEVFQYLPRQSHRHSEIPPVNISMNV